MYLQGSACVFSFTSNQKCAKPATDLSMGCGDTAGLCLSSFSNPWKSFTQPCVLGKKKHKEENCMNAKWKVPLRSPEWRSQEDVHIAAGAKLLADFDTVDFQEDLFKEVMLYLRLKKISLIILLSFLIFLWWILLK